MNNGEDLKNTIETSMQHVGDRERFKRTKTIKRKGLDGVSWLDHAAAHRAKKPLVPRDAQRDNNKQAV